MAVRLSEAVRQASVQVCRDAFWYHDDVKDIFLSAGMPAALWDRHATPDASKARVVRAVLAELRENGEPGEQVQRRIVQELCVVTKPHPKVKDVSRGRAALEELRQQAKAAAVLSDPQRDVAQQRRAAAEQRASATRHRVERIGALRDRFYDHLKERPRTRVELQRRGYDLEAVLADLFELYDLAIAGRTGRLANRSTGLFITAASPT